MSWPNRKLSDDSDKVAAMSVHGLSADQVRPTTQVVAPCCGQRQCAADMVVYVPGEGLKCDACRRKLERDPSTEWTRPKLMRAMGAPAEEVQAERAKEVARQRIREAHRADDTPIQRQQIHQQAQSELRGGGMPQGAELPEQARRELNNPTA